MSPSPRGRLRPFAASDLMRLEVERLDRIHAALWPRAMKADLGAIDRILRLSERRLLLQGRLDALEAPPASAAVRTGRWDDAEAKGDQGPAGPGD